MKLVAFFSLLMISFSSFSVSHYYPDSYKKNLARRKIKGDVLRKKLFTLLTYKHIAVRGKADVLSPNCTGEGKCYYHRSLGYKGARKVLFGKLHLDQDSQGYFVQDVYCRKLRRGDVGPNKIPNHNKMNCEHTWPQSKFSSAFPQGVQRSDLHHLYPTDNPANGRRGNHEFRDGGSAVPNCSGSFDAGSSFEPPSEHKGNAARSIFYFAVRYNMKVSKAQEDTLRRWHISDPVSAEERERNDMIHKVQGNRNPFIDYPHLIDSIRDF